MGILDKIRSIFAGGKETREPVPADEVATPSPVPVDPLGAMPGPVTGMTPPAVTTPPPAEEEGKES